MNYKQLILVLLTVYSTTTITLPLHNGFFSPAGEYTVSIQLGSPPQTFQVQVDTGSFKLAVPCSSCNNCQGMKNPLFDSSRSSSFSAYPCDQSSYCDECGISVLGPNSCLLHTEYQDSSSISGTIEQDLFYLPGMTQPLSTPFGCITSMNKEMVAIGVDGIWGVGKGKVEDKSGQANRLDQLITGISAQVGSSTRILALCIAVSGGFMNIGSVDNSLHTQPGITVNYDGPDTDSVGNSVTSITLGQFPIASAGSYPNVIVDSGSTTSLVSPATYSAVVSALDTLCDQQGTNCVKTVPANQTDCYKFQDVALAFSQIPPIAINFAGNTINWYAQEYLAIHDTDINEYCVTFKAVPDSVYVLGDDFMMNKDIVFGQTGLTIYPMSKCSGSVPTYGYHAARRFLTFEPENINSG